MATVCLRFHGRLSEIINAGGVKVSPELINSCLTRIRGVADAASFGVDFHDRPTEIWAAVVTTGPLDEATIIDVCRKTLNSRAPHRVFQVAQIPRNAMGKILTNELRQQLAGR